MDSFYTKINRIDHLFAAAMRNVDATPSPSRFVSSTNFKEDASSRIRNERIMAPMCIDNELG